jgi:hypothetical protein
MVMNDDQRSTQSSKDGCMNDDLDAVQQKEGGGVEEKENGVNGFIVKSDQDEVELVGVFIVQLRIILLCVGNIAIFLAVWVYCLFPYTYRRLT